MLPAGSTLALRAAETIDSAGALSNRSFAAVISRDLNGNAAQTVLPSGSPARLVIISKAENSGSGGSWELCLASVTINGDSFLVGNESVSAADTAGARLQSAGAALGRFLGGVPGTNYAPAGPEGKSHTELSVSGTKIWIPSGSLLTFRLDKDIVLVGSRK